MSSKLSNEFGKFLKEIGNGNGMAFLSAEQIDTIQERCEVLLKYAIREKVYDVYEPNWYERTETLINSVTSKLNPDGTLFVYHNIKNSDYRSSLTNFSVGDFIPYWINTTGHQNKSISQKNTNMFHHYPSYKAKEGRKYLNYAKKLIENEFKIYGIKVKIFDGS